MDADSKFSLRSTLTSKRITSTIILYGTPDNAHLGAFVVCVTNKMLLAVNKLQLQKSP